MDKNSQSFSPFADAFKAAKTTGHTPVIPPPIEDLPHWKFREMSKVEENHEPIHEQFFNTDKLGDLNDVLVREAVQNSLDAYASKEKPVKVFFHIRELQPLDKGHSLVHDKYLNNIWPHIRAEKSGLQKEMIPSEHESIRCICIEDFNTIGLEGDPKFDDTEAPDDKTKSRNHFFYFWRNIGRSGKTADKLGSWGVGKQVFPASSRINIYFGLSCRYQDGKRSLMGKGILKIHHLIKKCSPFGYWGIFEKTNSDYALPVLENLNITEFCSIFSLKRRAEPGLSIVVPYVKTEFQGPASNLARAAIHHYLYPILSGKIEIHVGKDLNPCYDNPNDWYSITRDSLPSLAKDILPEEKWIADLVKLIQWGEALDESQFNRPISEHAPKDSSDWNSAIKMDDVLDSSRNSLNENGQVAFKIPVRVCPINGDPEFREFKVLIGKTENQTRVKPIYVRQGIDIANVNKNKLLEKGYVAIFVSEDQLLSELLRDAEPPSHDDWNTREGRLDKWDKGAKAVRFAISSIPSLVDLMSRQNLQKDPNFLLDVFSVALSELSGDQKGAPRQGSKKKIPPQDGIPPQTPKKYSPLVTSVHSEGEAGFNVSHSSNFAFKRCEIHISCAYMTSDGNPLRKYSPLDFKLNDKSMDIEAHKFKIISFEGNRLSGIPEAKDFHLKITGFDPNRDLYVNAVSKNEGGTENDSQT